MPRAIWSGAISFGLVNVPVKLFSAVSPKDVRFNQLEEGTGARIRQKRVSAETGEEVPYEKIVKGFEISPDRYVIIAPEELEALDPKATRAIDIEDFVDLDQIDPVHYERPYYLVPEKGATKAYRLLLDAMKESNKVAIARLVLRTKQYLAAIRPMGDVLCLETLLFADEVVPAESLDGLPRPRHRGVGPGAEDGPAADRVAVDRLRARRSTATSTASGCSPSSSRRPKGQEIVAQPAVEEPAKVVDLMAALEASLAAAKANRAAEAAAE